MAGTVRERSPGHWQLRVFVGRDPVTGKPKQLSRSYAADRREPGAGKRAAEKKLASLVAAVERGEYGGTQSTLGSLLDEWLAHSERMGRSPKTLHEYKRKINTSIRPTLGAKALDKLTAHDLDRLYASQLAAGLSPSTVLYHHRIIGAALKQGRKWGWVDRNVAEDATPPAARKVETKVPSPEQVTALISEAARPSARNPELATIVILAALTGMRRGELCGLQWGDIDWQSAAVVVRQSIWQTPDGIGTKGPKSHQARRLVLGEQAMVVLGGRHARAEADATGAVVDLSPDGYVFSADPDGARPLHPDSVTQAFERLCRRMELLARAEAEQSGRDIADTERWPFRLHDLRHYTATQYRRRHESEDSCRSTWPRRRVGDTPGVHREHQRAGPGRRRLTRGRAEVAEALCRRWWIEPHSRSHGRNNRSVIRPESPSEPLSTILQLCLRLPNRWPCLSSGPGLMSTTWVW